MDADAIEHAVTPHRGSPTAQLRAVSPLASERAVDWSRQAARAVERGRLRLGESTYLGFGTSSEAEPPAAAIGMVRTDGRIGGDEGDFVVGRPEVHHSSRTLVKKRRS